MTRFFLNLIFLLPLILSNASYAVSLNWNQLDEDLSFNVSEGAFAGVCDDVIIIAGGETADINVYDINTGEKLAFSVFDKPRAFGASVAVGDSLICIGGVSQGTYLSDVINILWDEEEKEISLASLPSLPSTCAFTDADIVDNKIYLAGGKSDSLQDSLMRNLWVLDMSREGSGNFLWQELPAWDGQPRYDSFVVSQFNGFETVLYIIGGKTLNEETGEIITVNDVLEFSPFNYEASKYQTQEFWRQRTGEAILANTKAALPSGQSHILIFDKKEFSGNRASIYAYHTITDTWTNFGRYPAVENELVLKKNDDFLVLSSESIFEGQLTSDKKTFGVVNIITLCVYMVAMVLVGVFFARRTKNTDDYFRGGQRIPAWVAGLSIFATMLSSITFLAIPAKIYATDWVFFPGAVIGMAVIPFVMYCVLPYFCRINAASAYEYLERRFNVFIRIFVALSFVIYQIGRMAVVMYLPAIALATITPFSISQCVLIIGIISVIYCTMGGLEAVVWTDAIQSIILLSGALISFVIILMKVGGSGQLMTVALSDSKLHMINWDWSKTSLCTLSFWVIAIGSIGQNLVPYVSDQAIVQRYMSVSDIKQARKSLVVGMIAGVFSTFLFFSLGTALYVYYKSAPADLNPQYQTDAIFPMFISQKLPFGIAGLVVAGVFAAAQSTVSTSMNSISTVLVTDMLKRFNITKTQNMQLVVAKFLTFVFGLIGTLLALAFVEADIKSLWESFIAIIGLFGSPMCGLFLLGMFTKRVNGASAVVGALAGVLALLYVKNQTGISFMLYAPVGILSCVTVGYIASFLPSFSVNLGDKVESVK
ncbi:MAG: sodium/solute symporter [Sedimentisphaeraceae bacterium JB056]